MGLPISSRIRESLFPQLLINRDYNKRYYFRFFAFGFRTDFLGCGGAAHTRFRAASNGIGDASFRKFLAMENTDEYHSLCAAIGYVAINWAITEHALDGWIAMIFHNLGGKHIHPEIPRSFTKKSEFLTTCFKRIEALSSLRDEASHLLQTASNLSKVRNDLIHGAITSITSNNGVYEFAKLDYEKQMHAVRMVHLNLKKFDDLGKRFVDLGSEIADLGIRISLIAQPFRK
ncbi:MAG: hypothetical protein ACYDDO_14615 [Acidiferrobacterales bacterium]